MQKMDTSKYPWEVFTIGVNFSANMDDDEAIDADNSLVQVYTYSDNTEVTDSLITGAVAVTDSTTLLATVTGGEDGETYKVAFRAYISSTKKLEEVIRFTVKS